MLALFLQPASIGASPDPVLRSLIEAAGLLVGLFGIAYREASKAIIHEKQIGMLKSMMPSVKEDMKNFRTEISKRHNGIREVLWRLTYFVPISAWIFVIIYSMPTVIVSGVLALLIPAAYVPIMKLYDDRNRRQYESDP